MLQRNFTLLIGFLAWGNTALHAEDAPDFRKQIEPLLKQHCYACHADKKQESGLRLDRRSDALRGGDIGEPAITPGSPAKSLLIKAISGQDPDLMMPPKGRRLTKAEVELLSRWITAGAKYPAAQQGAERLTTNHWSFQPINRPSVPKSNDPWIRTPIDAFILARLTEKGLAPSQVSDKRTFIRRLYLTLHGLPPSVVQVTQFLNDKRPGAYDRLVERALASPRYGERWGRHWLDVVRFAESDGFETNRERLTAFHYRDYVIQSLNQDKPFDRFVKEQLAGDAMGEMRGTGFLVGGPNDIVKGRDPALRLMQRQDELADYVNTTGTSLLGLTLGCARCHNHKFDPILQRDFYSLQAVFSGVAHGERVVPSSQLDGKRLAELSSEADRLRVRLSELGFVKPKAEINIEVFRPVTASRIRFTILATNASQPCIDELEVFCTTSHGKVRNVALASAGGRATSSSNLPGYPIHKLEHVNDGKVGNSFSWISNEPGKGWVQVDFDKPYEINKIVWSRDRLKRFTDRVATQYLIEASVNGKWVAIAGTKAIARRGTDKQQKIATTLSLLKTVETKMADLRRAATRKMYIGNFRAPEIIHRLYRGEPSAKREVVLPDTLTVLGSLKMSNKTPERERRQRFADWIVSAQNPLTARVFVNRLWHYHFGTGIVASPSDFGANGQPPSHPQLLDWLAAELVRSNWSVKHIHRLLLTSNAFRQSNRPNSDGLRRDADCRLLWRFPPRRLEAEAIRDCILSSSGSLDTRMGGKGFLLLDVQRENVFHYFPKKQFGPPEFRRMVYMTKIRQEQDGVFGAFDCPDGSQTIPRRSRSTTPIQALNLLNSQFVMQQSQLFAERLRQECGPNQNKQVARGFQICFGRPPEKEEAAEATAFVNRFGLESLCRSLLNANEFLFIP